MDVRQLEMFKTVAEVGGFTGAGAKLHVSHSAISRQIKLLEQELQNSLFSRSNGNKGVSLTEAGKVLLPFARTILGQIVQATQSVSEVSRSCPRRLYVGTGTTMLTFFLLPVLEKFKQRYPTANVLVETGLADHILEEIRAGTIGMGIISLPIKREGFSVHPLYREEIVLVVGKHHPLARKRIVQAEQLRNFPIIIYPRGSGIRRVLDHFFRDIGISPLFCLELENEEAIEKAVTTGLAISFLTRQRAASDRFHFLRVRSLRIYRDVALVHQAQCLPEHSAYFSQLCFEAARLVTSKNTFIQPLRPD
jgi:DNA-binding transcriptional LysR family regulator